MMQVKILEDAQHQQILEAAFHLLETIGVEVHNEKAIDILKKLGSSVEDTRVKIPRTVVMDAIKPHLLISRYMTVMVTKP